MQLRITGEHQDVIFRDYLALAESGPSIRMLRQASIGPPYRYETEVGVNGEKRPTIADGEVAIPFPDLNTIKTAWRLDMDYRPWQMCAHLQVFARWKTTNPYFLLFDWAESNQKGGEVPFTGHSLLERIYRSGESIYVELPKGVDDDLAQALTVQANEPKYFYDRVFVMAGAPEFHKLTPAVAQDWFVNAIWQAQWFLKRVRDAIEKSCYFDDMPESDVVLSRLLQLTSIGRLLTSLGVS